MIANLVRQHPVEELVTQLKSGKLISKDQVIRESKVTLAWTSLGKASHDFLSQ